MIYPDLKTSSKGGPPFHGLLLIDKPTGLTSHAVVDQVRKVLKTRDIGHTGTLDPLATGLLVLVVGEATKLSSLIVGEDKAYEVRVRLGVSTDSLDRTGQVVSEKPIPPIEAAQLQTWVNELTGEVSLPVPLFSAKKVDGQPLYKKAHAGEAVLDLPRKLMEFFDIELLRQEASELIFALACSKGSFIRSWVSELGEKIGCGALVQELRRTRIGRFWVKDAISLDQLPEKWEKGALGAGMISIESALVEYPPLQLSLGQAAKVRNGAIPNEVRVEMVRKFVIGRDRGFSLVSPEGKLLALVANQSDRGFFIQRGFNL